MGWFIFWILCAIAGATIGASKGVAFLGFLLGLVFGPFGIIFAAISRGNRRDCPACLSKIHPQATVCPVCKKSSREYDEVTRLPILRR